LRQVLSQALNQENDEDPAAEAAARANERTSNEETQDHSHDPSHDEGEVSGDARPAAAEPQGAFQVAAVQPPVEPLIALAFLDRIPLGILVYRHDGLLYANRQFLEISGYCDLAAIEAAGGLSRLFAEPGAASAFADHRGAQALAIVKDSGERLPVEGRLVTVPWS